MRIRMNHKNVLLRLCAVVVLLGVGACGVKSEPSHPDGSSYPLTYPALSSQEVKQTAAPKSQQRRTRTTTATGASRDASGYYTPPPPATELLVK